MKVLYTLALVTALFLTIGTAHAQTEKAPSTTAALDSTTAKEYFGKYDAGSIGTITVVWEQGKLMSYLEGKGSAEIKPTGTADVFSIIGYGGTATFIRDDKKKVIKVLLEVQGQEFEGVKF